MTTEANRCPKCLTGMVSLRDERKHYGPEVGLPEVRKTLSPVAIDRTYTCDKCGYMATHREPLVASWLL
jgi:predicted RNA-binding Zn-ribbon protein involved in translation (DUF1610 family)